MKRLLIHVKHERVISGCLLLLLILSSGCGITFSPLPKGPCPIDTLLIDNISLPGAIFHETGSRSANSAPAKVGIEKIGTSFSSYDKGGVVQYVYRFSNARDAQKEYDEVSKYYFSKQKNSTTWESPGDLNNLKLHADSFKIACSTLMDVDPNVEVCQFTAQYGTYETYLSVDMIALDHNDLLRLVGEIDRKMSLCLDRK